MCTTAVKQPRRAGVTPTPASVLSQRLNAALGLSLGASIEVVAIDKFNNGTAMHQIAKPPRRAPRAPPGVYHATTEGPCAVPALSRKLRQVLVDAVPHIRMTTRPQMQGQKPFASVLASPLGTHKSLAMPVVEWCEGRNLDTSKFR